MPIQIGQKTHSFSDPTGLLSDCHRRIEMFLSTLENIRRTLDQPLTPEVACSLELSVRYFQEAAPKHTADEEASLFPRLRKLDNSEVQAALTQLNHLEEDHRAADRLHEIVDHVGRKYLATGQLNDNEIEQFRESVAGLRAIYEPHIRLEDEVVFPLAKRALKKKDKAQIAAEMARRRG